MRSNVRLPLGPNHARRGVRTNNKEVLRRTLERHLATEHGVRFHGNTHKLVSGQTVDPNLTWNGPCSWRFVPRSVTGVPERNGLALHPGSVITYRLWNPDETFHMGY